jgi:hypothetical protein
MNGLGALSVLAGVAGVVYAVTGDRWRRRSKPCDGPSCSCGVVTLNEPAVDLVDELESQCDLVVTPALSTPALRRSYMDRVQNARWN